MSSMKAITEQRPLLRALSHAQGVVERRNTLPILSSILIDARDDMLHISATDTDMEIIETVTDAQILTPGAATVDAHTIHEIVRKSPEGCQIEMECEDDSENITLGLGRSRFHLRSLDSENFPGFSDEELPHGFVIPASELRHLIKKTRFIIPTDETRHYITGLHLHRKEEENGTILRAAATDGHRLACISLPLPSGAEEMPDVIIPRKTIQELQKLLEGVEDDVVFRVAENKCRFAMDGVVLTSKLIDGKFPDYERVIPKDNERRFTVNRTAFKNGVDRVSIITSEKSRAVKLKLEANQLRISATNQEGEDAHEDIAANYDAEDMEIGFNGGYLLEISDACSGDDITFVLKDSGSPAIIRDSEDDGVIYIIMPMRI